MKFLKLIAIGGLFLFSNVYACMVPNYGPEYDSLIKIDKLNDANLYYLSFPRSVNKSKETPVVTLDYASHAKEDESCIEEEVEDGFIICPPLDSFSEELNMLHWSDLFREYILSNKKEFFEGEFEVQNKKGYSISVRVMWPSEICITTGFSIVKD